MFEKNTFFLFFSHHFAQFYTLANEGGNANNLVTLISEFLLANKACLPLN